MTGPNGAGKSSFARLLVGATPTLGSVNRPGAVGLGRPGGTTLVFQRPESQVLGVRVRDDVVWGLPVDPKHGTGVDVEAVLATVGSPVSPTATRSPCRAVSCSGSRSRPRWRAGPRS